MELDPNNSTLDEAKTLKIYPYGSVEAEPTNIEYIWKIPNVSELLKQPTKIKSPPFAAGRWLVRLNTNSTQEIDVFLNALPTANEIDPQTKKWTRSISSYSFSLRFPICRAELKTHDGHPKDFTQANSSYGRRSFVRSPSVESWNIHEDVRETDSLIMVVKICEPGAWTDLALTRIETLQNELEMERKRSEILALTQFDVPERADVAFVFHSHIEGWPREGIRVWSVKKSLTAFSEYFSMMFESGMQEGIMDDGREGESDEDLDDIDESSQVSDASGGASIAGFAPRGPYPDYNRAIAMGRSASGGGTPGGLNRSPSGLVQMDVEEESMFGDEEEEDSDVEVDREYLRTYRKPRSSSHVKQIPITQTRYSTYRALIFYLLTGSLIYAPLRSHAKALAMENNSTPRKRTFTHGLNSNGALIPRPKGWPLPVSPKSIFRVADIYGIVNLREEAKETILRRLTPMNVTHEVFSAFSHEHEQIRQLQINFLVENWNLVKATASWKRIPQLITENRETASVWSEICLRMMCQNVPGNLEDPERQATPINRS